jgi:hypothetical protein
MADLMHELTHVQQYGQRVSVKNLIKGYLENREEAAGKGLMPGPSGAPGTGELYEYGGAAGLKYALTQGTKFSDFGFEQQGDIVADYYLLVKEGKELNKKLPSLKGDEKREAQEQLDQVKSDLGGYIPFIKQIQETKPGFGFGALRDIYDDVVGFIEQSVKSVKQVEL